MTRLIFTGKFFICRTDFASRSIPRKAGFIWSESKKTWYTTAVRDAFKLREYADASAKIQLERLAIKRSPWLESVPFPKGLTPLDFQVNPSAVFALSQNKSYLGLDPGLGKTIVAAMIANALQIPTVVICPPFLARNTEVEFEKWSTWSPKIVRLDTKEAPIFTPDILIVPDSLIHREEVVEEIRDRFGVARDLGLDTLLIVDEAHRYKTRSALRTVALLGGKGKLGLKEFFSRQVYLSGTPMPNRPVELYPILSKVAPETIDFMTYDEYAERYCGRYYDGFGYIDTGESNLEELQARVYGAFMLRLKKKDVLKSLPPKTEELVIIGDRPAKLIPMETRILRAHSLEDLMAHKVPSDSMSGYRRELGLLKVKPAVEFVKALLDETDEAVLLFAYHKDVISNLTKALARYRPLVITGNTPKAERHETVKTFQTDKSRRLFIGNYLAAGLGLTLTKATRVVFAEFSWVPAENDQASDRAHRIGQRDNVLVQFLIYKDSIDRTIMETNFRKKRTTSFI